MLASLTLILLGAVAGGFVNGLTGFGTSLTALPFWLYALAPPAAAQLAAAAAVVGHVQTLPRIWTSIVWRRSALVILTGLAGVPAGTWLLPHVSARAFKLVVGWILVGYCGVLLTRALREQQASAADTLGSRLAAAAVGFGGGVLGGLAGLSGVLPILWSARKPWPKDEKRALIQTFNLTILVAMLLSSWIAGLVTADFWRSLVLALPGTVAGAQLGAAAYHRLEDRHFERLVLVLLLASGASLVIGNA
jgi:uncharacterized membrane protein YfcA